MAAIMYPHSKRNLTEYILPAATTKQIIHKFINTIYHINTIRHINTIYKHANEESSQLYNGAINDMKGPRCTTDNYVKCLYYQMLHSRCQIMLSKVRNVYLDSNFRLPLAISRSADIDNGRPRVMFLPGFPTDANSHCLSNHSARNNLYLV